MVKGNSFSTRGEPQVAQLLDTEIDFSTLTAGDVLTWEATEQVWINAAGGGGGGGIVGTDDDALFKQGGNANTFTNGITRDPTLTGRALTLNTTFLRCGIGGASNAVNMVNTLEVFGGVRIKEKVGINEIVLDGDNIGNIIGGTVLRLYSNNTITPEDICVVDSFNKKFIVGGTMQTLPPTAFDFPNGTSTSGIYKMKLEQGANLWTGAFFDGQNPFNPASVGFPSGAVKEYQNDKLLMGSIVCCRNAINSPLATGFADVFSVAGTFGAGLDQCYYDPLGSRGRLTGGTIWDFIAAPSVGRSATDIYIVRVSFHFEGQWSGSNPNNRCNINLNQYRSGGLYRNYTLGISNNSDVIGMSGNKTILGGLVFQDYDASTDDFQVEAANFGVDDILLGQGSCEFEFILSA